MELVYHNTLSVHSHHLEQRKLTGCESLGGSQFFSTCHLFLKNHTRDMVPIEKLNHAAFFLEPQGFRAFVREQSGLRDGVREAFMVRPHDFCAGVDDKHES